MCTIGGVSNVNQKGERLSFLMKTIDGCQTETLHGIYRAFNGNRSIFSSMMRQPGINIGMNQNGLAITISYSDCWEPGKQEDAPKLENDTRALANAAVLTQCKSVDEGIEALKDFVVRHPHQVGGNHLLVDAEGNIALLEQYKGKYEYEKFSERGYQARANNSYWLIKDKQSNLLIPRDSFPREEAMENFLRRVHKNIPKGMSGQEIVNEAKSLFSRHSAEKDQIGSICIHGLNAPGARLFGTEPCYTLTTVILDLKERTMIYSLGSPCSGVWKTLKLD